LLSIGGSCEKYLKTFKELGWIIQEVKTRYSTDANTQKETIEYFIMNYRITDAEYTCEINPDLPEFPIMKKDIQQFNVRQSTLGDFI
jgi:hypothetical protein